MRFQLWHDAEPDFRGSEDKVRDNFFRPGAYVHVADVETDVLGRVFELTNHIDSDWTLNDGVTLLVKGGVRSTSVGDVVVDEAGRTFLCTSIGWREIESVLDIEEAVDAHALRVLDASIKLVTDYEG